jgi:hypothetical protein
MPTKRPETERNSLESQAGYSTVSPKVLDTHAWNDKMQVTGNLYASTWSGGQIRRLSQGYTHDPSVEQTGVRTSGGTKRSTPSFHFIIMSEILSFGVLLQPATETQIVRCKSVLNGGYGRHFQEPAGKFLFTVLRGHGELFFRFQGH